MSSSRARRVLGMGALLVFWMAPSALAAPFAYVAARKSDAIVVVDLATHAVTAAIPTGPGPMATAVRPDGARVFATVGPLDQVLVIDTATNAVVATVPVGDNPTGIDVSPDGAFVYVANTGSRSLTILDARTNAVRATVPLGNHPFAVAVHPDGKSVYVGGDYPGNVSVIDTATRAVTATIPVGDSLGCLALHPSGPFLYVADSGHDELAVVDTAARRVVKRIGVGRMPVGVAVHPSGGAVYVTNLMSEGVVSVIDTSSHSLVYTVTQPGLSLAQGAGLSPDGSVLYVVSRGTHDLFAVDTATNQIFGARVPVGGEPTGFGRFIGPGSGPVAVGISRAGKNAPPVPPPTPTPRPTSGTTNVAVVANVPLMPAAAITAADDIVFSLNECIEVQDLNGGTTTAITGRPSAADPKQPVCDVAALQPVRHVAADHARRRVAFNVGEDVSGEIKTQLYVIDLPSRTTYRILPDFARIGVGGIDFAPNGDMYVAGVSLGNPADPRAAEDSEIFRVAADLGSWQQVTDLRNRGAADVSVSADGAKLAFNTLVLTTGNLEVMETNLDGTQPRVVIQGGAIWLDSVHDPEHSSNDAEVVYSRIRLRKPDGSDCTKNWGDHCQEVYRQPVAGGTPTRVSLIGDTSIVPDWKGTTLIYHFERGTPGQPGSWLGGMAGGDDGQTLIPFGTNMLFPKWIP